MEKITAVEGLIWGTGLKDLYYIKKPGHYVFTAGSERGTQAQGLAAELGSSSMAEYGWNLASPGQGRVTVR